MLFSDAENFFEFQDGRPDGLNLRLKPIALIYFLEKP